MAKRRIAQLEAELASLRALIPPEVTQGQTVTSPFTVTETRRSIVPWRRREVVKPTEVLESATPSSRTPVRAGYLADIPRGGATEWNQGYTQVGGAADRRTLMQQLLELYTACPWAATCVDTVARFCSAGPMQIDPLEQNHQRQEKVNLTSQSQKCQALFDYVNPAMNFRQLIRGIFTDLQIYGDAFVEVVWALGEPVALYPLPCPDMLILADEHGIVSGYIQRTETNRRAPFDPHEVIHFRLDSPRGGLYGLGPTEKTVHPIVTWVATEGLLKKRIERGNPPSIAINWDPNLSENEVKRLSQKYRTKNLGAEGVGAPVEFRGDTQVHEWAHTPLAEYGLVKDKCRDEICGGYGVPPAIATIIESGNLGGGTGTSQFKNFRVNTCGPYEELVLESFTFYILERGFGVTDMRCSFGDVDWRDDKVIETIRQLRVSKGAWTINRYRDEIGEPPVEGGDDAIIIQTRDVVLVKDLAAMSKAAIDKDEGVSGTTPNAPGTPASPPGVPVVGGTGGVIKPPGLQAGDGKPPAHATEAMTEEELLEAWEADARTRRRLAMRELVGP